ncbi:MAG TPA: hypothetical protein VFI31_13240 [Pirellulales bacterium]|nr:hypothetical protein [Pirellulales bacterium]
MVDVDTDLPQELRTLVEKRVTEDRRVKARRAGPPRRSLKDTANDATASSTDERRQKERRQPSKRRTRRRR